MAAVVSFTPAQPWIIGFSAGMHNISLTNYDNTSYPSIAQTSKSTEINGSFVEFSSGALTITDTGISDGEAYIYVYISGGTTVLAEATNTAPTYDVTKSGWYDAGGTKRCVAAMTKSGASYSAKRLVMNRETDLDNYVTGTDDLTVGGDFSVIGDVAELSLDGGKASAHYTGSSDSETDFPIGSILFALCKSDDLPNRNESRNIYLHNSDPFLYIDSGYNSSDRGLQLVGTWRARGAFYRNAIYQRIS